MFCKIFYIFLISYNIFSVHTKREKFERILYGEISRIEDFPYFAGLVNCGAAIISDRHLITAAHCFEDESVRVYIRHAYVGGETTKNSQVVKYKNVIIHPAYLLYDNVPYNDVAIIVLAAPLMFSKKVQPLKLPERMGNRKTSMVFVGRGIDETGEISKELKSMNVKGLTVKECITLIPPYYRKYYHQYLDILAKMNICAKRPGNRPGLCNGDSGSPLVEDGVLVGLASFGGAECATSRLGFYSNVAYHVEWIKNVTGL
ncbi:trypsin 5G1-like isoform X2 [Pieris brassicae]|uniref:trypsin 5G1-like isoform X2 n=1 Tax=Pieris brassicae TaxID=7116 RepID=UPI001E661060|nr:trypsin 5G1-like isoform X2 [Pieris brassicae]